MTQIKKKKKKKAGASSGKKDFSVRHFSHQLTIAREMPKTKGKKHVSVNLFENIHTAT